MLVLGLVGDARAGKYEVVQCGWHVGADAGWADTTGGEKFRPDSYCAPSPAVDPFDGAHLKSFTRASTPTVSGTRFARWRWEAPPGTAITRISGTWWHALHDGFEQRIGAGNGNGGFDVFAAASSTDTAPRGFVAGFSPGRPAIEDRLLCARLESKSCSLTDPSWSAVRALTLTVEDTQIPTPAIAGPLVSPGWKRGVDSLQIGGADGGSGIRFADFLIDSSRMRSEFPCAKALVSGQWKATRMRPCELGVATTLTIDTRSFSDRAHPFAYCVLDFSENPACSATSWISIDNNPPAHPRSLQVLGGDGWHRGDDFDLAWENPDQGPASPIVAAGWRVQGGPAGIDTGAKYAAGTGVASLSNLTVPRAGAYAISVWLRDEAGNEAPSSAATAVLRLDDVAPGVAFAATEREGVPETVNATVTDEHSGPAGGEIDYRRLGSDAWLELPTKSQPGQTRDRATLAARIPDSLGPGTYLLRADAVDGAGNHATTTRRVDGTEMAFRKQPDPPARSSRRGPEGRRRGGAKTRVFARLRWHGRLGTAVTVPFGERVRLSGRLLDAAGAGISGRRLRIVCRPSKGALAPTRVLRARTGDHGGFRLDLPPGPSRRVAVAFRGDERFEPALRAPLSLRVRGGVTLRARPAALETGETLDLRGRVKTRGAPLPRRGKLVAIQYLEAATDRWRPVLVTRSDHSGRYRARYRFRYVSSTARIRLRAVAMAEERWPYAPGASRSVAVRVSGAG
jgi:hypothetical protein